MIWQFIGSVIFILKSLDLIYLFQTKEYRLDRIAGFFKETGFAEILYLRFPRFPAKSARNLLIFSITFAGLFIILQSHDIYKEMFKTLGFANDILYYVVLTPIFSLLSVLSGVEVTEILAQIHRKTLIEKAARRIKNAKAVFIGISGSYGKTTTKELLYQLLLQKFKVAKTDANYNSAVGVAISVLKNLKPDTQYFIAELGAYRKGEIKASCDLIHPKYAILTGIGNQHLSLFGSKQNLRNAKAELPEALPADGKIWINADMEDPEFFGGKTRAKKVFYSLDKPFYTIKTNLTGRHNLQNLLPCIGLATELGMEKKQIDKALMNLKPVVARLSREIGINGSTVLNDSYNSNIEGFSLAIQTADKMSGFNKKYLLSRGLIELGEEKTKSYLSLISTLNKSDLILLTTDILFKKLEKKGNVKYFTSEKLLLDFLKKYTDKRTLLVIEGRFENKTIMSLRGA